MKEDLRNRIDDIIKNKDVEEKEIIFQLKQLLNNHELHKKSVKESKSIAALVSMNLNQLNEAAETNFIKTGYFDFDDQFGGFALGELVVIGARPGVGKTQLLVNLSLNISLETPILFCSLDLSENLMTHRFISSLAEIPLDNLLQYKLNNAEKERLSRVEEQFSNHKIFINEGFNNSMSAFRAHCQKMIEEKGVKVIFVDYLQLMSLSRNRYSRELDINYICRELKNIAKDFNVCVIASSQLSRAVETRFESIPKLSDLRDSGSIEENADKVILIYRSEYHGLYEDDTGSSTAGSTYLNIAKNNSGKLGTVQLLRDSKTNNFQNFNNEFSFSPSRLEEMAAKNPALKDFMDDLDSWDIDRPF